MDANVRTLSTSIPPCYTVQVIEDDGGFRDFLSQLLEAAGFNVLSSASGKQGIEDFHAHSPDLVITDIVMAGVDGLEVIAAVKQHDPQCPVIAMSSAKTKPHKQNLLSLAVMRGANAVLAKPFNMDELRRILSRLLKGRLDHPYNNQLALEAHTGQAGS